MPLFICDSPYCGLSPKVVYISAWALALLVLTGRAMPGPLVVGRASKWVPTLFSFMCLINSFITALTGIRGIKTKSMKEIDEQRVWAPSHFNSNFLGRAHPHSRKNVIYYYRADDDTTLPTRYEIFSFAQSHGYEWLVWRNLSLDFSWNCGCEIFFDEEDGGESK